VPGQCAADETPRQQAKVGMKSLSSVILGVGLTLLQGWAWQGPALAADAPGGAAKGSATKSAAAKGSSKATAPGAGAAAEAAPTGPTVALEPDGVAFGMSSDDVAKLYDRWWDKQFISRYQKANPGPKTRELDFELAEKKKVLRRIAIFDGRMTSFDKSEFREEFAHGSDETMTSAKLSRRVTTEKADKPEFTTKEAKPVFYTRRFFFYRDKLWKVYDEYRLDAASPFGADFKDATARVEASLGKTAKRTRGPDSQFENVAFDAGNTRVRVLKLPKDAIAIVRSDTALTKEVLDRRAQQVAKAGEPEALEDDIQAVIR
jgi:hypothetical protein